MEVGGLGASFRSWSRGVKRVGLTNGAGIDAYLGRVDFLVRASR
jgi:hypothetical protein